jgi:uncharacterized protein
MNLEGEHTFPATREVVWELLQDPGVLRRAMPGTRELELAGDGVYRGTMRIGVGPVTAAEWKLSVELRDRVEPEGYTMVIDSSGALGFTRGSARVRLEEADGGASTVMRYSADLQVGGKVAGVGQRLLDQVARMLTRQGLDAMGRELRSRLDAGAGG